MSVFGDGFQQLRFDRSREINRGKTVPVAYGFSWDEDSDDGAFIIPCVSLLREVLFEVGGCRRLARRPSTGSDSALSI